MNETQLCLLLEMRSDSAVTLFGTIFLDGMTQNQADVSVIFLSKKIHIRMQNVQHCRKPFKFIVSSTLKKHVSKCYET